MATTLKPYFEIYDWHTAKNWQRERNQNIEKNEVGRPKTAEWICQLIRRIATENPTFGAGKITGELTNMAIEISTETVRYLKYRYVFPDEPLKKRRRGEPSKLDRARAHLNSIKNSGAVCFSAFATLFNQAAEKLFNKLGDKIKTQTDSEQTENEIDNHFAELKIKFNEKDGKLNLDSFIANNLESLPTAQQASLSAVVAKTLDFTGEMLHALSEQSIQLKKKLPDSELKILVDEYRAKLPECTLHQIQHQMRVSGISTSSKQIRSVLGVPKQTRNYPLRQSQSFLLRLNNQPR